jgi:hypothetical protein
MFGLMTLRLGIVLIQRFYIYQCMNLFYPSQDVERKDYVVKMFVTYDAPSCRGNRHFYFSKAYVLQ